jgi:hypothetical protein
VAQLSWFLLQRRTSQLMPSGLTRSLPLPPDLLLMLLLLLLPTFLFCTRRG